MRVRLALCCSVVCAALSSTAAFSQVHTSVDGVDRHLWAGAEFSDFSPDYGNDHVMGENFFANMNAWHNVGAQAEIRLLNFNNGLQIGEKMYLLGPTYTAYRRQHLSLFIKGLAGAGTFNYPALGYGSYFAYELGGGAEYQFSRKWKLVGEYNYDTLPSAPGYVLTAPYPSNGLNPRGFGLGVEYRVF